MKKYFIKNCPNYYYDKIWEHPHRCNLTDGDWSCDVCMTKDDEYGYKCVLKQIVKDCQEIIEQRQEIDLDNIWGHSYSDCELSELNGQCKMARKILRMLDIEECENE